MDEQPELQPQEETGLCKNCNVNPIAQGYPNPLCESCRQQFIRFPIPIWVKGFGIGVSVLVLLGLFNFPKQITIGIHMRRADNAIAEKKYLTAEKELRKVLVDAPEMKNAKLEMVIAAYYNLDIPTLAATIKGMKDVSFEKNSNFNTAQDLIAEADNFFPSDSLYMLLKKYPNPENYQDQFRSYVVLHPDEPYAVTMYVNIFSEKESPAWSDSMIHKILDKNPAYMKGIMDAILIARMQHHYDSALNYCRDLLALNAECSFAVAAQSRVYLAKGDFPEGIELAKKACAIDSTDGFSQASLALGYHLNHQTEERDRLIASKSSDSTMSYYMDYVKEVMSGKEKFN